MAFDVTKLPRFALLAELLPGQALNPEQSRTVVVHCRLPGSVHANNDQNPSLQINPATGWHLCKVTGCMVSGVTWRDLVCHHLGAERWKQLLADAGLTAPKLTLAERWAALKPETTWSHAYGILPALSGRYLRSGRRYDADPWSDSVIGVFAGAELVGIKCRLPAGSNWQVGVMARKDPRAKYAWVKGSKAKQQLFLGDRLEEFPGATVVFCAGEKDALVAASHLEPAKWCPVTGTVGEGGIPSGAVAKLKGRRVVIAYDGDQAGHNGAWVLWQVLRHHADVKVAKLPEDVPPGGDPNKPGWDVADVVQGGRDLELFLQLADAEPPAKWEPEDRRPNPTEEHLPTEEEVLEYSSEDTGPPVTTHVERELDDWELHQGLICRVVHTKDGPKYSAKFLGTVTISQVLCYWTEDAEAPGGWLEEQEVTYEFALAGGRKILRVARPGAGAFRALLEHTDLAAANHALSRADQGRLWLWVVSTAAVAERLEERRAIGPHRNLGWLAPPNWTVRGGALEKTSFTVASPGEAQVLERYRFAELDDAEFRKVARWIAGSLIPCDRANRAYTLPLLGAFLSAPIWQLPALAGWQRSVFFVQGPSGVGKTQLCRYFWSFWGDFVSGGQEGAGLTTWTSSATYVGALLHDAVGVPFFVSDWKRKNFSSRDKLRDALGLIQAYADRSSRGRGTQRGGAQRSRPPRCTWVIDGEDLPEGEQATLGRMTILSVEAHDRRGGPAGLCADASEATLRPDMVAKLPAISARWVAWVQRKADWLTEKLGEVLGELEELLDRGSTNRARILRSYAVQVLTALAFGTFLEEEAGLVGQAAAIAERSLEVHVAMANRQLRRVQREAAGDQFLEGLRALLLSGSAKLLPASGHSGGEPFKAADEDTRAPAVGTYHAQSARIWPGVALPLVQRHVSQGGGDRIEFSRSAIEQQLAQDGTISTRRARVDGHPDGKKQIKVWSIALTLLGSTRDVQEQLWEEEGEA